MAAGSEDRSVRPPRGAFWCSADDEFVVVDEDEYSVDGSELRIMYDTGAGPLWAIDGLLSDEPEWMKRALGISDGLVADLLRWLLDMDSASRPHPESLDERAEELAGRLQAEVGSRFRVWYHR